MPFAQVWKNCAAVSDMSTMPSGASLWRTIGRNSSSRGVAGHSTTTSAASSSFGSGFGGGVAGAVSSSIVLRFFSSFHHVRMVRKRKFNQCFVQGIVVGAFDHGVDHLLEYLHAHTLPKINRDEPAQLLGGRSLVNHHHQHLFVDFHSNLMPIARITGSSLFLLMHLPHQHRDTRNCPREAIRTNAPPLVATVRGHRRASPPLTPRVACSVFRRSRTSVQHDMLFFFVCAPSNDQVDGNFRTRHRSLRLCVINAKSTGLEQIVDPLPRPWFAQM